MSLREPTIVFVTVCTKERMPWLTQESVHRGLVETWRAATAWTAGCYVLMPNHLHLFCSPRDLDFTLDAWVRYWKSMFTRQQVPGAGAWQRAYWDTRLRRGENYTEKWEYVRANPVRAGLCSSPDEWPYQGELNVLPWH